MFIPRHPVVENQFCSYGESAVSTGVGGVVAYAGSVVFLNDNVTGTMAGTNPNFEPIVYKMAYAASPWVPFGFVMQKVKTGYHQVHPTGFSMPGDLGSSDVIAQPSYNDNGAIAGTKEAPIGVAHLGIWDTVHYTCEMTTSVIQAGDNMKPGDALFAAADEAKVTNSAVDAAGAGAVADKALGNRVSNVSVGVVVKGASIAKCQANFNNTTLYPIRIKLLV